jgi:RHS repeat-associated protein
VNSFRFGRVDQETSGIAALLVGFATLALAAFPVAALGKAQRFDEPNDFAPSTLLQARGSGESTEAPAETAECIIGQDTRPSKRADTKTAPCPRLPSKIAPSSSGTAKPARSAARNGSGALAPLVTNEAGDSLEVSTARPGTLWTTESAWVTDCSLTLPYPGSGYMPCGYVSFYDAGWETSEKAPQTNVVEDGIYDACGKLVASGKSEGWHVVGTEYTLSGWHASDNTEVPTSEPAACLGIWKMVYTFTETFSDKETLTDSVEVPFAVAPSPLLASAHWGGGNPAEFSCSQQCYGDPVNTATGEYSESATDLAITGRGPGLQMTRTYSSAAAAAEVSSPLGQGWAFSYGMSLSIDPESGDATVTNANGSRTQFDAGTEGFVAPPRVLATLVENEGGTYAYTIKARTTYAFDSSGKLISIADLNGEATTLAYDEAGRLKTAIDGAGRTFSFEYDEAGRLEAVADSTGRSVSYGYGESGRLDEVTDVRGGHERFTYDGEGLLLTREDARENVVLTNTYDAGGRVLTQTDGLEAETSFEYTEGERTTTTEVTGPRGYVTRYVYENGILSRRVDGAGTFSSATWSYEYDPVTLATTAVIDPNGHTSHASYDANGNQTSTKDALGNRTESTYDALDDLTGHTDANGVTTTYEYDEDGNLLSSSTPLIGSEPPESRTIEYAHGSEAHPGDVTALTDPNGKTTDFAYDAAGDLESVIDAAGNETTYTYDERSNRLTAVSPRGNAEGAKPAEYTTTFTYDTAGNRLTATNPLGDERKWSYDADGNLETETDANGHTTTYVYDAANQRVSVKRPGGQLEQTAYDKDGNVESQTDGLEHSTTYEYDPLDHLEASTDPLGRTTNYLYDGAGNLTSSEDPQGRTTTYGYDPANELVAVGYSDAATPDVEYGYDPAGQRTSMSDGTGETSYEYDSLGRLTTTTDGHGDMTSYGYDLAGNATAITYPNGKTVNREFDDAERLASVTDWLGHTTSFAYDPDSNLKSTTFPEGTANVDEYGYDRADRMSAVQLKKGAETPASLGYSRDKVGLLEGLSAKGLPGAESEAFEYDEDSRLTKSGAEGFGYDAADNLTSAPGTTNVYDAANELEAGTGAAYSYDKLGERTRAAPPLASYASSFGSFGSGTGKFSHPAGIAIDAKGNLWVVDEANRRVEKFSQAGEYLSSFGSFGTGNGQFSRPTDVAIDANGNLWVTDAGNNRVEEFSEAGKYLTKFGSAGSGNGQFAEPESIAIDSGGNIWVADTNNGRVQEFTSKAKFVKVVGKKGTGEGQFQLPDGIAIGSGGHVWVADWANHVVEFSEAGAFIRQVGSKGSANGQFLHALAIDVDAEGHVWVGDEGNNRIQEFNESGEYLGKFGTAGSGEGQFSFGWPMGVAAGSGGNIWVSDSKNNRVQRWGISKATSTTYKYDQAGDLTAVERPKAGEIPAIEESYAYDGNGLRASQTVSATTSHLVWDPSGGLPLLLSDEQASYIYGPGGLPVEQISSGGTPTYYHHDQLGSTRMLTDASGKATATFSYGAYGKRIGSTGTQTTPLGYAGQYTNTQSGLQYLRARVYDPATGQFLTRDPLTPMTRSPYGYVNNDPLGSVDPSGLCNANPFSGGFWTEGNCISESAFNPITYYEEEIEAIENGCGYWDAVSHGVKGAAILTIDAAGLFAAVAAAPAALSTIDVWVEEFATLYPRQYLFLAQQASKVGTGPPVASTTAAFFWGWLEEHIRR